MNRQLSVLLAGTALALVACGGSASSTATPAATAAPTVTQAPASVAAESGAPASAAAGGPDVSLQPGAAADLEAMLPSEANGITFKKSSFDGSSLGLAGVPINAGELQPLLEANGKTVNDVRFALATPTTTGSGPAAIVMAIQVKGVDAEKLLPVLDSSGSLGDLKETTIAGKSVRTGGTPPFGAAIYLKDDVLFYVLFADQPTTESIISQLP
ncbi:MAG TPA: hypothetical protein VFQ75_06140 [Candidatus Limnocylindrales bacterium]|nr:hypothetical protein [Candidatus Limnocylindrales bacterium]